MDPKHVAAALEAVLESKKEKLRLMEESLMADLVELEEKRREVSDLEKKKQQLLANEASIDELVKDFLLFTEAEENNDAEIAQALTNVIATMLSAYASDNNNGGPSADYGGDNTGGSATGSGGIDTQAENAESSDHEQAVTVAFDEADSDSSDGSGESESC